MERVKMSQTDRAKQFMPFDALKGLQNALRMKEYQHERQEKGDLTEEAIDKMSKILLSLKKEDTVKVKYYEDGHYKEITGKCKILYEERKMLFDLKKIDFDDIFEIEVI